MGISDWFTIFGLILAIYAIFSAEERRIISLKLSKKDPYILVTLLFGTLFFIKYQEIYNRFSYLKKFDVSWGINSSNWALIILLTTITVYSIKLYRLPNKFPSNSLIQYYQSLMKQDFKVFYRLFNRYEDNATNPKHFEFYKSIIFQPAFLDGVNDQAYYYTNLIDKIDQETFRMYFLSLLNNPNSIFYSELAKNNDTYLVEESNIFLTKLLHDDPALFFNIGGLLILRDWHIRHLENEKIKKGQSIYNQETDQIVDNFELDLPLYLHIIFIKLLYEEAIDQRIDTSVLSDDYTNMQSILSNLVKKCIEAIDPASYREHESQEYPLKFHYLISSIFDTIEGWLEQFNKSKNFVHQSSLFNYFPSCMKWCIKELIYGHEIGVISEEFMLRQIHFHLLDFYYKHDLNSELANELESECILEIPAKYIETIFTYSLDEKFALEFYNFKNAIFRHPGSNPHEMIIIQRLYNLLKSNNLI